MGELFNTFATVVVGIVVFVSAMLALYWVTTKMPKRHQERSRVVVFLGPALFLLAIGLIIPAVRTIYLSLFNDNQDTEFVFLGNYLDVFTDEASQTVLRNNLLWAVFGTGFSTFFGLMIARFADSMKGENIAKAAIFLPTAISFVGAGIIWKFIYAPPLGENNIGLLNAVWVALDPVLPGAQEPNSWLLENQYAFNTLLLIVVMIWIQTGFATVVFSASIKGVPDTLLEAARIDGATERQVFTKVVIPYIRPAIITVVTTTVIAVLKVFDIVKAMTGGNFETNVIANEMFAKSFVQGRPNYGAALAVVLFIAVIPVVIVNQRAQRRAAEMF